jgi:hypothetical protein
VGSATGVAHPGVRWPLDPRPPPAELVPRAEAGPQPPVGQPQAGLGLPQPAESRSGATAHPRTQPLPQRSADPPPPQLPQSRPLPRAAADPPRILALLRTQPLPGVMSDPLGSRLLRREAADRPRTQPLAQRAAGPARAGERSAAQALARPPGPEPPTLLPLTPAGPRVARAAVPAPTRRPERRLPKLRRTAPPGSSPAPAPWPPDPGGRPAPGSHPAPEPGRRRPGSWRAALALEATGRADPAQARPPGPAGALAVAQARSRTPRSAGSPLPNGTGRPSRPGRRRPRDPAPERPADPSPRRPARGVRGALVGDARAGGWGRSFGPRKLPRAAARTGVGPSLSGPAGFRDSPCPQPASVRYRRRAPGVRLEPS